MRILWVVFIIIVIGIGLYGSIKAFQHLTPSTNISPSPRITYSPTPTINEQFTTYKLPHIPKKDFYRIAMVGDSMTLELGVHGGKMSEYINNLYQSTPGHQRILIDNYAIGSKNILNLHDQMTNSRTVGDTTLQPLVSTQYDMILIESFGYNPLSQLGLEGGQKKQTEILDQTMKLLTTKYPNTAIVFVATIAPNKEIYGQKVNQGSALSDRTEQATERMAYLKNHVAYAKSHNIPIIDIYDKSLTQNGDGNPLYINSGDDIHPSVAGIDFISHEIANFIYNSQILPK